MAYARIRVQTDTLEAQLREVIKRKKRKALSDKVKRLAAEMYKGAVNKYVPMNTGNLRKSARVRAYKGTYAVFYEIGYSRPQYDGSNGSIWPSSMWKRHTPNTFSHWNRHLTRAERADYFDNVKHEMIKEMNNG